MKPKDKAKQFGDLAKKFDKVATDWLLSKDAELIDELQSQWDEGQGGNEPMPEYSEFYSEYKRGLGRKQSERYDLNDTGDFRSAMIVGKASKGVQITSTDEKLARIEKITKGIDIWRLNKEHASNFAEYNKEDFAATLKIQLTKK